MSRTMAERTRFRLTIAYDGSGFAGWQSQPGGNTVQDALDRAVASLRPDATGVQGAGRTDAGVHALGQVAHFDVSARGSMDGEAWWRALNATLPPKIRILACEAVDAHFHARFSASGKIYRYDFHTGPVLHPLRFERAWHVRKRPDEMVVREVASLFVGRHDFASFAANRGDPGEESLDTVRTIERVDVVREGEDWSVTIEGEGFLYKMVRLLVGAMVRCGQGWCAPEAIRELLEQPGGGKKSPLAAPAEGLYLVGVRYRPPSV